MPANQKMPTRKIHTCILHNQTTSVSPQREKYARPAKVCNCENNHSTPWSGTSPNTAASVCWREYHCKVVPAEEEKEHVLFFKVPLAYYKCSQTLQILACCSLVSCWGWNDDVCTVLFFSSLSISLIEPGPVITEFERKVYDEGMKTDLSNADKVTADMFTNIYLKNYKQIFETLGQTPEDIAEVHSSLCHILH